MSEVTLEMLFALSRKILEAQGEIRADLREIKSRLTLLEEGQARLYTMYAGQSGRLDRIESRLERIERRLELNEEHP